MTESKTLDAVITLLASRAPDATVCPSEVARALAVDSGDPDWRTRMPSVHAATDRLLAEGRVGLSWKGAILPERNGPYRIRRGKRFDNSDVPDDPS